MIQSWYSLSGLGNYGGTRSATATPRCSGRRRLMRVPESGKLKQRRPSSARRRGVAQPGRAPGSGPGGRRFESSLPDHLFSNSYRTTETKVMLPL